MFTYQVVKWKSLSQQRRQLMSHNKGLYQILHIFAEIIVPHSLAAVRCNLTLESIVIFMVDQVTDIKGKLTGHLSAFSNFRYGHYSM